MLIKVKVFPCSSENEIVKKSEDSFEVSVREKPVMGLANRAVINLLSDFFKVSEKDVKLIKGFRERNKIFNINN
jgi:uncharacterized protein (TIGR00251 family)